MANQLFTVEDFISVEFKGEAYVKGSAHPNIEASRKERIEQFNKTFKVQYVVCTQQENSMSLWSLSCVNRQPSSSAAEPMQGFYYFTHYSDALMFYLMLA